MELALRLNASGPASASISNAIPHAIPHAAAFKSGLPSPGGESTKAFRHTSKRVFSHEKIERRRQTVGVRASAVDNLVKNLQGWLQKGQQITKEDSDAYVSLSGTLVVQKKCLLNYLDTGCDFWDDTEDRVLDKKVILQLVSADQVNPDTQTGKLGMETVVENWFKSHDTLKPSDISYPVTFKVPNDFGTPGAFTVRNRHTHEVFVKSLTLTLPDGKEVYFGCNSWVYNVGKYKSDRIFFSNQVYLPGQTPPGLVQLREAEKVNLRGDGHGERRHWDRIYDYDVYNDLGFSRWPSLKRPNLGGSETFPYPRRCRTGRKADPADPSTEVRVLDLFYIPRDEFFDSRKQTDFLSDILRSAGQELVPAMEAVFSGNHNEFKSFKDVHHLYSRGVDLKEQLQKRADVQSEKKAATIEAPSSDEGKAAARHINPFELVKNMGADNESSVLKFKLPQVIQDDEEAWMEDEEFGRQTLAGVNPIHIQRLKEFPPVSSLGAVEKYGDPTSAIRAEHIEPYMEGLTVQQALNEKRLYTLDYHDLFLPYMEKILESKEFGVVQSYATRTILFLMSDGKMMPVAIELALPRKVRVLTPPKDGKRDWLWELAKAHVRVNDNGYHQLYSHWVRTHATIEPVVIATNRQLSVLHPLHLLLLPHFKNTLTINSAARTILINAGGLIERCFMPGRYSVEVSSAIYGALWRFDNEALPNDLIKRGMAEPDQNSESGVKLVFEDYPYALDGLDIWCAQKSWVQDYVNIHYCDDDTVQQDAELQEWWFEIRTKGHADKQDAEGWPTPNSKQSLIQILTTIIWLASAHHAAVNFGQYAYTGFMPNHATTMRRHVPEENSEDHKELLSDPEKFFLQSHSKPAQATIGMASVEILSSHATDEVYLGEAPREKWTENQEVLKAFEKYGERLKQIEQTIEDRNNEKKLRNRSGPVQVPYTLLKPSSPTHGVTGMGVPNSVSI